MMPLLKLPYVVAEEIFETMSTNEIFFLSFLSKRIRKFIKTSLPKSSKNFHIRVGDNILWASDRTDDRIPVVMVNVSGFSSEPSTYMMGTETMKFDGNEFYCFSATARISTSMAISFIEHLLNTFNISTVSLYCMTSKSEMPLEIMNYFKKKNLKVKEVDVTSNKKSSESHSDILNLCSSIESLRFTMIYDYEYNPPVSFSNDSLTIFGPCKWLKFEDIMQCKEVTLCRGMPIEKLIALFKKLIGTDCWLKSMRIPMNNEQDFPRVVEELSGQTFDDVWNQEKDYVEFEETDGSKVRLQKRHGTDCHVQKL